MFVLGICVYFCFANIVICTIFRDLTYMHEYTIFAFLFLKNGHQRGTMGWEIRIDIYTVLWLVTQSRSTLCDPMDCSLPGSSVHGILQAGILEWVAMPSFRVSSQPRDQTQVFCTAGGFFFFFFFNLFCFIIIFFNVFCFIFAGGFFTVLTTREAHKYTTLYKIDNEWEPIHNTAQGNSAHCFMVTSLEGHFKKRGYMHP